MKTKRKTGPIGVCKYQRSLMDLRGRDRILVYNRDRSIEFEGDTPREFLPFFKEHGPKFFAKSSINPDGKIGLDDVVPMEDW